MESIAKSFNTTRSPGEAKTRTLVGNWYEDELWAETAAKHKGSITHSALLTSNTEFDPDRAQETTKVVHRSSIGKRQQALQEEMLRKAMQEVNSEIPDIPTAPEISDNNNSPHRIGNQPGKKTHAMKNRHVDIIGSKETDFNTTNIMGKRDKRLNDDEVLGTPSENSTPYWQDTAVTLYATEYVPGKTAGDGLTRNSTFSNPDY